jgi:hypothetical protein
MRSMLTGRARRYATDAARAWERAPVEVSTALVLAVAFSCAVEAGGEAMRSWLELAITGLLVITAAWTATLLHALGWLSTVQRWLLTAGGAVAAALYGSFVVDLQLVTEVWRAALLLAAAALWLVAAPWVPRRSIDEMREVTGRFLLRGLGAALYCAALYAGLALAVGAVNTLFELNLDGAIYAHVFGWIALALGPWILFGGLDEYVTPGESGVAPVVHRMAAFLVPPLVAVYFAILYAYAVRMALTGELPKNLVSPLVFAAGVLVGLAALLFDPRQRSTLAGALIRFAPPLFVPLSLLGMWTILVRVEQYGWTEFRLVRLILLVAFGGLAAGACWQLLRKQRFALHLIPLGLAVVLVLSAVGPWSVHAVARRGQEARLEMALHQAGVDPSVPTPAAGDERTIDAALYDNILNTGHYLARHHGPDRLPSALAHAPVRAGGMPREAGDVHGAMQALGLRPGIRDMAEPEMRYGRLAHAGSLDLEGVRVRRLYVAPYRGETASGDATAVQDGSVLHIQVDGQRLTARLDDLVGALHSPRERGAGELAPADARLAVRDAAGRETGSLLVLEVNLETAADGIRLHRLDALLLYRPGAP